MEYVVALVVLAAAVALVVAAPLRAGARDEAPAAGAEARASLEAAKEAKYREIRDAELDYRMGKLSEADWRATDGQLRNQAIELLKALDALDGGDGEPDRSTDRRR